MRSLPLLMALLGAQAITASAEVSVTALDQETRNRVSRTVYEYGFRVTVHNNGAALIGLTATTSSTSSATEIVAGALSFGTVAAGDTAQSEDLLVIRHNRLVPFDQNALVFDFDYTVPPAPEGALLEGDPSQPASSSATTVVETPTAADNILGGTLLDKVVALIAPTATIGEVNAVLEQTGSRIASRSADPFLTVLRVPPQPDAEAIDAFADQLAASAPFSSVIPAAQVSAAATPPGDAEDDIEHLYLSRFPALFNVLVGADGSVAELDAACAMQARKPLVLIPDLFGTPEQLSPGMEDFEAEVPGAVVQYARTPIIECDDNPRTRRKCSETPPEHGYDVTTVGFAHFDAERVTGAMPVPECFEIFLLPLQGIGNPYQRLAQAIVDALAQDASRRIVVNLSWGFDEDLGVNGKLDLPKVRLIWAAYWKRTISEIAAALGLDNLEDNVLFVAAAGNERQQEFSLFPSERQLGLRRAEYSNAVSIVANDVPTLDFAIDPALWGAPALAFALAQYPLTQAELRASGVDTHPPPQNVMMVGSTSTPLAERDTPIESAFSDSDPDVWTTGEFIPTLSAVRAGTSFAAPQVSALAAAIWLLQPELTAIQVKTLIASTARPIGALPRVVDAYAALLATDLDADAPLGVRGLLDEAPVREAILDVNSDGVFDDDDLLLFLEAYFTAAGVADLEAPIVEPGAWDWSRFDLNGDGFVGIDSLPLPGFVDQRDVAPFDLDAAFPTDLENIELLSELVSLPYGPIDPLPLAYDENRITDLDVLCYYANTQLYRGNRSRVADLGIDLKRCLDYEFFPRDDLRVMEQRDIFDLIFADVRVPAGRFLTLGIDIPWFDITTIGSELTFGPPSVGRFNISNPFNDDAYGIAPGLADVGFSGVRSILPAQVNVREDDIVASARDYALTGCTAGPSVVGLSDTTVANPTSTLVAVAGQLVALRVTPFSASACVIDTGKALRAPVSTIPSEISDRTIQIGNTQSPPLAAGDTYLIQTLSGQGLIVIRSTDVGGACSQDPPEGRVGYAWSANVSVFDLQSWVEPDWPSAGIVTGICGRGELEVIVSN